MRVGQLDGQTVRLVLDLYPHQGSRSAVQDDLLLAPLEDYNNGDLVRALPPESQVLQAGKVGRDRLVVVMLDPGHGGKDPGPIGKIKSVKRILLYR